MANADVQLQHMQVSAIGDIEPLHVGLLLEALTRMVHTPPEAFVERETLLHRSDDEASRTIELTPVAESTSTSPLIHAPGEHLDPSTIFSMSMEELGRHSQHRSGWDELIQLLQWLPSREVMRYGLRFVLPSDNALVLNELRVFRAIEVRTYLILYIHAYRKKC